MALDFPTSPADGQVYDAYKFDASIGAWRSNAMYADTIPAGAIIPWATNVAPSNWLLCDGQAVSRTTYAALFSVIGTTYGAGNGTTTFNVPNLVGRTLVGRDAGQSEFLTLGQTGGTKTHTLTVNEMPSHTHTQDAHAHTYYYGTGNMAAGGYSVMRNAGFNIGSGTSSTTATNQNTGGSQPHNNLQPYAVLNYIIKTTMGTTPEMSQASTDAAAALAGVTEYNTRITNLESFHGSSLPVFQARLSANYSRGGSSAWTKIGTLTTVEVNQGGHYNSTLCRFVAPVTGIYEFNASFHQTGTSGGPGIAFVKNATTFNGPPDGMVYGVAYNTAAITRKFQMNANDYVEVWAVNFNGASFTFDIGYGGLFSGQLIT